jgi:hypothetical protein
MSRASDFSGARDAGVPVGVVAGELTGNQLIFSLPRYLDVGGKVFVDSGAFAAFLTGETIDWTDVIQRYQRIIDCTLHLPTNLYVVAPDVVGDQAATLTLIGQWKSAIVSMINAGANVIVPIQHGNIPAQDMINLIKTSLGTDKWVAGIPSNRAAMPLEECATLSHHTYHILGRVQKNDDQIARIIALRALNPAATVTADANWIRSRIAKISQAVAQEKSRRFPLSGLAAHILPHCRTSAISSLINTDTWGY